MKEGGKRKNDRGKNNERENIMNKRGRRKKDKKERGGMLR